MNPKHLPLFAWALLGIGILNAICGVMFVGGAAIAAYYTWHTTDDFGRYGTVGLVVWGVWLMAAAAVQISGGLRIKKLRGRVHGIVALVSGPLCVSMAWIPSLVLVVPGLMLLTSKEARVAFETGAGAS